MKTLKNYIDSVVNKVLRESLEEKADEIINKLKSDVTEKEDIEEGECSECGGMMSEGECSECGYKMEGLYEESDPNSQKCQYHKENFGYDDERTVRFCGKGILETTDRLHGRQKQLDRNKNNRIDSEDFNLLRKSNKKETKEGKKFPDLSGDGKVTRKDVLMGRGVKLNGKDKKSTKESVKLTEDEMIDLIERIVNEEKDNINKQSNTPGLSITKRNLEASKKENNKNIKDVTKKMMEYLKDGSKGDFSFEPKIFPKGNGELGEMKKKAYKPTKEVDEYIENFAGAALENTSYDEIHPNEGWVSDNIEGSSRTGNGKWANSVETEVNEKRNKIRKNNYLSILKKKEGYNRQPQPVYDSKQDDEKEKNVARIFQALESTEEKKEKLIKEDIDKMNRVLGYNKKTQ